MAGFFITLEGIEGAGKSTQMAYVEQWIRQKTGREVVSTREPGGTPVGEAIRNQVLSIAHQQGISDQTEVLLMFAARSQHVSDCILPALQSDKVVLCDRYTDSSLAYQGGGRQLGVERVQALANWLQPLPTPDLTLLFDLPVSLGLERAAKRSAKDRFESEQQAFFQRVRDAYLQLAHQQAERFRIIDASQDLAEVEQQLQRILQWQDWS